MFTIGGHIQQAYRSRILYNLIGFQALWLSLILLQDYAIPIAVALLLVHLALNNNKRGECATIALIAIPGIALDALLTFGGLYQFNAELFLAGIPVWLWLLWIAFACTVNFSLRWLVTRKTLFIVLGPPAAAASYYSAMRLGAVEFPNGALISATTVGAYWLFVCVWISALVNSSSSPFMRGDVSNETL